MDKRKLVASAAAALAVGGAGAGVAATQIGSSRSAESKAIVNDAAKELGIEPSKLSAALKKAFSDRIDAAVKAGRLTEEQGQELKQRLQSDDFPLFGPPAFGHGFGPPHMFFGGLDAAADYLGLTEAQLHERLGNGKTLAEIAKAEDKSVDGLKDAMRKNVKEKLDAAVKDGRLSKSEEEEALKDLDQRIDDLVNDKLGIRFRHHEGGFPGRGWDREGPPPFGAPGAFQGPTA